ncbi:pentapeptide repeat-containing protein [Streptomyces sp. NPDC048384]|uniref:pentapeptide repeat-containing protein n=1 Tax=Streptomyces sp. NPDC048384 TaxID=3155487 RepID=UPI00341A91BB
MNTHLPRRRAERRGLRLWPVGTVLALTFTAAVLVAVTVFYTGWELLGARGLKAEPRIESQTLFDLVKLSFGVVAGAGALVALVVAYRRQRVDEDGALREATRLHTERFTTAVAQLGEESAAVRLGGVHALAGLADDAPTRRLRQTCIDVMCAYLRLPYTVEADLPADNAQARHAYVALREVRHTIIRLIRDHLRLEEEHPHSWRGHDFDLTAVTFDGGDLSKVHFVGGMVDFSDSVFCGSMVDFRGARFSGSTVDFSRVDFSGGTVDFSGSDFSAGTVSFRDARFSRGTVHFSGSRLAGGTQFSGSAMVFSGSEISGSTVSFDGAWFSGGQFFFDRVDFSGGTVDFNGSRFSGDATVEFGASFSGSMVSFCRARFFGGMVNFSDAVFSGGLVDFRAAQFAVARVIFGGMVSGARFSGGRVDFRGAEGVAPINLVPTDGSPLPAGLSLPSTWHPSGT